MSVSRSIARSVERVVQRTPQRTGGGPPPPPNLYVMNAVRNDNTTNIGYMQLTGAWQAGVTDQMIISYWIRTDEPGAVNSINTGINAANVRVNSTWKNGSPAAPARIEAGTTTTGNILAADTVDGSFVKADWHHILSARNGNQWDVYIDGVVSPLEAQPTSATQDFATYFYSNVAGRGGFGSAQSIGDAWMYAGQYLDFSIPSNLAKFIDTFGQPVFLGANGELPIGTTPDIFFGDTMVAADWNAATNLGTMGAVTNQFAVFVDTAGLP